MSVSCNRRRIRQITPVQSRKIKNVLREKLQISLFALEKSWKMFCLCFILRNDFKEMSGYIQYFFFGYLIQGKDQNQKGILMWYFFLLHYRPKTTKDPSGVRLLHWVKLSFNTTNTHSVLQFDSARQGPVLLLWILTRTHVVYSSPTENSPQYIQYFVHLRSICSKTSASSCFWKLLSYNFFKSHLILRDLCLQHVSNNPSV